MRILAVSRAARFSPNAEVRDARLFTALADYLRAQGHSVILQDEDTFASTMPANLEVDRIVHMARSRSALRLLAAYETLGVPVINSPTNLLRYSTRTSRLACIEKVMPFVPQFCEYKAGEPYEGGFPVWAKALRNDQAGRHVEYIADSCALVDFVRRKTAEGITSFSMENHVAGTQVKFYGVDGTDFSRCCCPENDTDADRLREIVRNTQIEYNTIESYVFSRVSLVAKALGMAVYGGDAVISDDGFIYIFDFNDFPSFGMFADEAVGYIAKRVLQD